MGDDAANILGSIGGLKTSVENLVKGQEEIFKWIRESHSRTAQLETTKIDLERRVKDVENVQVRHSDELAESRGVSKTNRLLAITIPPAILAIWEGIKTFNHH